MCVSTAYTLLIRFSPYYKNEHFLVQKILYFCFKRLKMQFYHAQKRNKNEKWDFLGSSFIFHSPAYWFFFLQKLHFLLPLRECVYVGSLLNNHSLLLRTLFITSTTLFILLSIKQSDTSHPPFCCKEYLSYVSIIGNSVRQVMTYYIYVYTLSSAL